MAISGSYPYRSGIQLDLVTYMYEKTRINKGHESTQCQMRAKAVDFFPNFGKILTTP